jgi:toxin ParE1/3/4
VRVVFADAAEHNFEDIGDGIARGNPLRALTLVRELRDVVLRFGDMPSAFPLVPRYEQRGIRLRVFGNYLIFYRIEADRVVIVRVLHGARDYESLLFPEE